jgi:hypothetical protein
MNDLFEDIGAFMHCISVEEKEKRRLVKVLIFIIFVYCVNVFLYTFLCTHLLGATAKRETGREKEEGKAERQHQ